MRHFAAFITFFCLCLSATGQNKVDRLYFDMRATFHQETEDGVYSSQLQGEHLNFHMMGHIGPKLDYRIRQRLNKKVFDEKNMFNATDMMYLNWRPNDKWSFLFGKYAVLIGGYEYDAAPIDVYYYSKFCNNIYQGFTFGASVTRHFTESQGLVFQVCNSPLSLGNPSVYAWNLAWNGEMAPWWKTIWSVNLVEDHRNKFINYISLGNHFIFGDAILDVDVMNRAWKGQQHFFFSDMTLISKFIWSIGKWNVCAKAGYEWNDISNVNAEGDAFDVVIAPGTKYFYAGCGLEWFPLGKDDVRLHAVYYADSDHNRHNFEFGLTWRLDVIKPR